MAEYAVVWMAGHGTFFLTVVEALGTAERSSRVARRGHFF